MTNLNKVTSKQRVTRSAKSKANYLNKRDFKLWFISGLKYVAPTLAIFFGLLSQGVPVSKAWPVALLAFYQSLSKLFSLYKES